MRRFSHVLATAVVVCALTVPVASAGTDAPERDRGRTLPKIVKVLKKVIKTLGDELSVPHP